MNKQIDVDEIKRCEKELTRAFELFNARAIHLWIYAHILMVMPDQRHVGYQVARQHSAGSRERQV
jgi:hypothetical protein